MTGYIFDLPHEYLRPALLMSLLSVWVLVCLFFYLNSYTRRRYFSIWSAGWLFYGIWLTLSASFTEASPSSLLLLKQSCVGTSALFMIWGSLTFLKQLTSDRVFGLCLGFLVLWSYLSVYHTAEPFWAQAALFSLLGLGSAITAYGFWAVRRHSSECMGARLLSLGFLLWGAYLACYPLWETSEQLVTSGFFISAVLQLFIAVSMIILVLEEARLLNQQALQRVQEQESETEDLRTRMLSTEERYRSLFTQASEAIVIAAAEDLRILELNDAAHRLLGIPPAESDSHSLSAFLQLSSCDGAPPQTGSEWFSTLLEQRRVHIVRADGTMLPVDVGGAPVVVDQSTAYQFFFREVTEKARLEQQLRQAEKLSALGQMISGVAHELNNPLAVIKGYLDLILCGHTLSKQTRADLEKVAHESDRAAKLVSNFLSFARERPPERATVDLNRLIERVIELREFDIRIAGVEATLDLNPQLPLTYADSAQLEQVLVNLVTNALHALAEWPARRRLKISTGQSGGFIIARLDDSGPGVPAAAAPHIFEPFFTTKEVGTGTGLGLSIAHSILAEHNGRIYYEPSSEGGAAFVMELPIVFPDTQVQGFDQSIALRDTRNLFSGTSARILVLDDERTLAEMLGEVLATLGHRPVTCSSPRHALELLQQQSFDLIFSDFRMPLMNGREFYERVNQDQPELAKRIIFLTGDVVSQETRRFLSTVGNPHLCKPFQLDAISRVIAETLEQEGAVCCDEKTTGEAAVV